MRITVLTVPDCPNAPVVGDRLDAALGGLEAVIEWIEVTDDAQAARLGMTGSPTVLVDGVDPFATADAPASVSCRLYRRPDGATDGAPSVADLRNALISAVATEDGLALDAVGRAGRGRLTPVTGGLRGMQQAILRHFAATGQAPATPDLAAVAAAHGRTAPEVLAELAVEDFLTLDDEGHVRAAYPFSAVPTHHRVRLTDGTQIWSMCAIDALGIPDMLDTDAVITSADPISGETISITSTDGHMTWQPATAVVYVGRRCCTGPAADVACSALNFFTSRRHARTWAEQHPDHTGRAVDQARAEALGRAIFGHLLTQPRPGREET
ncbi:alkylmercury lyase [Streptomyces sp. uw30]|uniref:alkylmercury lyase family protein n=1 Tax=Streptomyces sp. uw30 TaxID=1828179 RepID=UPI0011CDC028|nr:alkylmercury lyase family protein [Streptomyces sp. uw30]TXS49336.1 alkylmercury lyase [Streptomyces sp. uw30]